MSDQSAELEYLGSDHRLDPKLKSAVPPEKISELSEDVQRLVKLRIMAEYAREYVESREASFSRIFMQGDGRVPGPFNAYKED